MSGPAAPPPFYRKGKTVGRMSYYYNGAGQRFELPEQPLEPPDCWRNDDLLDKETAPSAANAESGKEARKDG